MPAGVFASGGFPEKCEHDHRWRAKGAVIIGRMPCDCPGALARNRGHHYVSCQGFTLEALGGRWRSELVSARTDSTDDGRVRVLATMRLMESTPIGYGQQV
jgi:hypothetical protein